MSFRFVAFVLLAGCAGEEVDSSRAAVVYGEDGRTEVFAHPNAALRDIAGAIAMKIDTDLLDESGPTVRIDYTRTLSEARTLCAGEPFEDQIEPGTCSGTLVDDRFILTAGHCMDSPSDCTDKAWLLGWHYESDGELVTLVADDVYRCARVIAYFDDGDVDHAIVELDRPVVGHTPVPVRVERAGLAIGTPVALVGHPNGIPMKIDTTGEVTWNHASLTWLNATVDAFNGNSGSGVFDDEGNLVALLRGGETDYVDAGGCNVVNVIDPPPVDDGEGLVYMAPIVDALCATPGVESVLCACDGPCVDPPPGDRCDEAEVLEPVSRVVEDTLVGFAPDTQGGCGGLGPDRVYTFTTESPGRLVARTSGYDSVLYLRAACDGLELGCNDDIDPDTDRGSRIDERLAIGTYYLFVDAYDADVDAFTLDLAFTFDGDDAGTPDAGADAGLDAAAPDAGMPGDSGAPDASTMTGGGGCNVGSAPAPHAGSLLVMLALMRRRRR